MREGFGAVVRVAREFSVTPLSYYSGHGNTWRGDCVCGPERFGGGGSGRSARGVVAVVWVLAGFSVTPFSYCSGCGNLWCGDGYCGP